MVDFIGIERVQELVARRGDGAFHRGARRGDRGGLPALERIRQIAAARDSLAVGVIELMPACDGQLYAFKYVNGHPKNTAVGLLTVTAFGVLADVQTGYPLLLRS